MKHIWSMKYAVGALALLAVGWFFLNIWLVLIGSVVAVYATSELQKAANIPLKVRGIVCASIVGILLAIHFIYGNKEVLLAAGIIILMALALRWVRHHSQSKES